MHQLESIPHDNCACLCISKQTRQTVPPLLCGCLDSNTDIVQEADRELHSCMRGGGRGG